MAKVYVAASSQRHTATAAPITALPCTIACWFRTSGVIGATRTMVSLDTAAGSARVFMRLTVGNALAAAQANAANTVVSSTVGTTAANTWYHGAAVYVSDTSRTAYLDGVAGATDTTSNTFTAPDSVRLGARVATGTNSDYMGGRIAEVGIWNVALTTAQIEMLASGVSPLLVRPDALVFYAPMTSAADNVQDIVGGLSLTPTNAPTDDDGPPKVAYLSVVGPVRTTGAAPTISSTSDSNKLVDESSFVITGTNLTSATPVTFKQTGRPDYNATAFISANDATTVTLTGLDVQNMSMAYGAATVAVTTAGGTSADFSITIDKKASQQYITLSGHTTGTGWALGEATANGDQLVAPLTTALGGTFAFVGTDGSYTITYPGDAPTNDSAYWAWFDDSDDQWYETTVSINPSAARGLSMSSIRRRRPL